MRWILNFILFCILLFSLTASISLAINSDNTEKVNIYFFWAQGCPHCAAEEVFLDSLEQQYSDVVIHRLEVTANYENAELLKKVGQGLGADVGGVPFTVVGKQYFIGWYNEEITGKAIEEAIKCSMENQCPDIVGSLTTPITPAPQQEAGETIPKNITLPIVGNVETKNISLPILTILIGALDGFNPCAMWVLLFLITLLFGMKNKKKMWIFGIVFLAASAFVYFMFMAAWLHLFLFIGFVIWVRIAIGIAALWAGYYNLKEYFTNPAGGCKVTGEEKRRRVFDSLKKIIQERHFLVGLVGLIALAFAVNMVELICSAGLPVVYTQILAAANLPIWLYYSYLLLYIFVFMLDDLIVFFVAMYTLQLTGISSKYSRASHLIGGAIMLLLGILLILKPEWLMFG